jgi:hypothetical protein
MAAAKSLMEAIARIANLLVDPNQLQEHPTSMLICFTGAADHIPNEVHPSQPEHELRFWKEFRHIVENETNDLMSQMVRMFNPTFIQSSSSETMGARVRAYMRDSGQFLGSSITIPSRKLHSLMAERVVDGTPDARLRGQKTVRVWAEVVHNFARVLMIDLYELPSARMSFWKKINRKDSGGQSINALGGWALTHRLQGDPDKQEVHIEADAVGALAEPELAWDELPGLDPTKLVQPELPQGVIDEMCLSSDSDRWVVGELLSKQTCQTCQTNDSQHMSFICGDKRKCPRCASQHQIQGGYEDPMSYLDNAIFVLHSLDRYKTHHPKYTQRVAQIQESSYQWIWSSPRAFLRTVRACHIMELALFQQVLSSSFAWTTSSQSTLCRGDGTPTIELSSIA